MSRSFSQFTPSRIAAAAWLAVALASLSSEAFACFPFPGHIRVGADATHCQANDIQSAINMAGVCPVVIDITREHTYTNQQLTVSDKYITFQGWGDGVTCADIPDSLGIPPYTPPASTAPLVTLDASGNGRVFTITGNSNVGLHNLTITGAQTDGDGGGISFDGQGTLYITNTVVSFNQAGYGAGINMNGSSGPASLYLYPYSLIIRNTANVSGGGIRMEGNSRLYALQPNVLIGYNQADGGYGGGVEVLGPARADIGSSGYGGLPVVYFNDAQNGGGISVNATFGPATARLFTTDPNNPVKVADNFANSSGGGIFLESGKDHLATACLFEARVDQNAAPDGAAIQDNSGPLLVNPSDDCGPEPRSTLGAVACAPGVPCNEINDNLAADGQGTPTAGAVINVGDTFVADRLHMQRNHGGELITGGDFIFEFAHLAFSNCLVADNVLINEALSVSVVDFSIDRCTFVGNVLGGGAALMFVATGAPVTLSNSIFDQPNHFTIDDFFGIGGVAANYVLSNDLTSLFGQGAGVLQGEPTFVDAANGDYHLQTTSLGVDFAPSAAGVDLDGKWRTTDLPGIANQYGAMDLGAYEIPITAVLACAVDDTLFCDPFGVEDAER